MASDPRLAGNPDDCAVIVGGGLAGLMTALQLAPQPVIVLAKTPLGYEAASDWAQGGMAAALGDDDSPDLHAADTLAAGDGLCDPAVVARITRAAPEAVRDLARRGVLFDRGADGAFRLGLEAAHGRRRIAHARGDGTGHEIMRALVEAVRNTSSVTVVARVEARRLVLRDGAVAGLVCGGAGGAFAIPATRVVIATGGLGALFRHTTNPLGAVGQGVALAARAGAAVADLEFVQFHPTALDAGTDPLPLISEAVRGEGAVLVDETGERFMAGQGRAELEPRDVVARAVWRRMGQGHRVFLDARSAVGDRFAGRFPTIAAICRRAGIDPVREPIPVRPAAHYSCGGIVVDGAGRTTLSGLWACGEAAATGLHGANRLASNSLIEAAVCARWIAEDLAGTSAGNPRPEASAGLPPAGDPQPVRDLLSGQAGVVRDGDGLLRAVAALRRLAPASDPAAVALMIAVAALRREESRGCHFRSDVPRHDPARARRETLRLDEAMAAADAVSLDKGSIR